jgi:Spirocyclase AveC-like
MIPAAVMIYRDDTGRTVAEKLARRAKIMRTRHVLGSFVVMLAGVNGHHSLVGRGDVGGLPVALGRARKFMIRKAFTTATVHRGRSRRGSGPDGRVLSPTDAQSCRPRRVAVVARPVRETSDSVVRPLGQRFGYAGVGWSSSSNLASAASRSASSKLSERLTWPASNVRRMTSRHSASKPS